MRTLLFVRRDTAPPQSHHEALARGTRFLHAALTSSGSGEGAYFRSQVRSRLLETALTLHLLRREGREPEWQARLRDHLLRHREDADAFVGLLAAQAVGHAPGTHAFAALERILQDLEYTHGRKRRLLLLLLMELDLVPFDATPLTPDAAEPTLHLFNRIYAAATRLLIARRQGERIDTRPEATFLRETQGARGGWEQQVLTTLVVLMAIGRDLPDVFERGLGFLARHEREDGGMPFCDNLNLWTSALAGLALCEVAPDDLSALHPVGEYVVAQQKRHVEGWSFTEAMLQIDVDTSTQCAQLLLQLDARRYREAIAGAQRYLLGMQREDGGYPTYTREDSSEVTMTANAVLVQALGLGQDASLREPLERGLCFLMARQHPDGSFERSWSLCETYSLFRVLWALSACEDAGVRHPDLGTLRERAVRFLASRQRGDGSWGQTAGEPGDVLSTAYALASLSLLGGSDRMDSAVDYLLSQQDARGAFPSRPDVVGPRPLVFDEPLLGTVFAVMALGMALRGASGGTS